MEQPILNKEASSFIELFDISPERVQEILPDDFEITIKKGFSILAKITSHSLIKANTINEQLYLMAYAYQAIMDFEEQTGYDASQIAKQDFIIGGNTKIPE